MMAMQLSEAAQVLTARHIGPDAHFRGVSTDSRGLVKGNLFVALCGPSFDGHEFVELTREMGAAGAVISRTVETTLPRLVVADTRAALAALAGDWRRRFSLPVIAITGSSGKTTVKEMVAAICRDCGPVLATQGNLNNDIGVPLTLFRLADEHRYAVIELGANHPGEIAHLTEVAQPTVAVVTNAGPAHLEGFGSIEGVARAKGEIFAELAEEGTAVINGDDYYAPLWRDLAGEHRIVDFSLEHAAAVRGDWQAPAGGGSLELDILGVKLHLQLTLPGRHNACNAMAAAATAVAAGVPIASIKQGLETAQPVKGRLNIHRTAGGVTIIDDSYNANPDSLAAALSVLQEFAGERWLVLGDMRELGEDAVEMHSAAGRAAKDKGVTRLFSLGELAGEAAASFGKGARKCKDEHQLLAELTPMLAPGVTVLVKGSRAMAMDRIAAELVESGKEG